MVRRIHNADYSSNCILFLKEYIKHFKISPFWIVVAIIYLQYRKMSKMERDILGKNQSYPLYNTMISLVFGLIGGMLGSVLFLLSGITINPNDFYLVLPLAIILSLIHPRFICFSYAGGIVSLIGIIFGYSINVSSIMFVIGVLHLVESFFNISGWKTW